MPAGHLFYQLVLLSIAKKASVFLIAKLYGFPRLYRRMMKLNRRLITDEAVRARIRDTTQSTFRLPRTLTSYLRSKGTNVATGLAIIPALAAGKEGTDDLYLTKFLAGRLTADEMARFERALAIMECEPAD